MHQHKVLEKQLVKIKIFNFKNLIMNLESLNLVELNAQEVQETEGGLFFIPIVIMCVLIVAASVYATSQGQYQEGQP